MKNEKQVKRSDAQNVEGKGGEEDRECDGRTALRRSGKSGRRTENNSKS